MKILLLTPSLSYGGAHKMMIWLANQIEQQHEVKIAVYYEFETPYPINSRVAVITLNIKRSTTNVILKGISYLRTIMHIFKYVVSEKPDLVITFADIYSSLLVSTFSKIYAKVMVCERNYPGMNMPMGLGLIRFKSFQHAAVCVFQTEGAKNASSLTIQQKSMVIPNPIKMLADVPITWTDRNKDIVFIGRFEIKQKRQDLMLDAFETFWRKHQDYRLVFYGDGADYQKIKSRAESMEGAKNIIFKGRVENIPEETKNARIFVLTSDYEGIPNSLLEALSSGLVCISTDCLPGGARMLLGNNENGLLVPRGNAEKLAEALEKVVSNLDMAQKFSNLGRKSCNIYKEEAIAKMWNECINNLALDYASGSCSGLSSTERKI